MGILTQGVWGGIWDSEFLTSAQRVTSNFHFPQFNGHCAILIFLFISAARDIVTLSSSSLLPWFLKHRSPGFSPLPLPSFSFSGSSLGSCECLQFVQAQLLSSFHSYLAPIPPNLVRSQPRRGVSCPLRDIWQRVFLVFTTWGEGTPKT